MKKKSVFMSMLVVLTVVLLSVGVVSCSSNDGINGSTWKGSMTWAEIEGEDDEDGRVELTVTFTSDDSGNWSGVATEGWDDEIEASESGTFQCI